MTGVEFNGRLGNQIFQLAFFEYLKTNNTERFFFFINPQDSYITKYFELSLSNKLLLGSRFISIFPRLLNKIYRPKEIHIRNIQVPKAIDPKNWVVYSGFFQTDWYVKQIAGSFNISLKAKIVEEFKLKFGKLFSENKIIVVHIRRTDYLKYGKRDISLPMEYFKNRLDAIGNIDDYKIIFVSDDIDYVKDYFKEKPNYIFSSNNEITDFQIIKNADIAIISNSSFAWWACYLSDKKQIVYGPKNWLGFRIGKEHPRGVMTSKFTWCNVID